MTIFCAATILKHTNRGKNDYFNLKVHYQMFGCGQELLTFVET